MSEYTSNLAGFQRAMEWSLNGPPEEAKVYAEAIFTPDFCRYFCPRRILFVVSLTSRLLISYSIDHVMNGQRATIEESIKGIAEWRAKISEYKPVV